MRVEATITVRSVESGDTPQAGTLAVTG